MSRIAKDGFGATMPYYQSMPVLFSCENLSAGAISSVRFTDDLGNGTSNFALALFSLTFPATNGFMIQNNDSAGAIPTSLFQWSWDSFSFSIPESANPTFPVSFSAYFWKTSAVKRIGMTLDGGGALATLARSPGSRALTCCWRR